MMKEIKEILNEGGAPVFTTYAVEIGDALWSALYDFLVENYSENDCDYCSIYRIEGIYEEGEQKFAILQNRETMEYFRMNFSITEENGFVPAEAMVAVEKEFVPVAETPQFEPTAYEAYVAEYAASKKPAEEEEEEEVCEKCGKPLSECECDEEEDKKDKYVLEEIPEYMELSQKYASLQADFEALTNAKTELEAQMGELVEFKTAVERKEKMAMINDTFYMLAEEDKKDVIENIDTYSLNDIEAKLSVICFRNKISFNNEGEQNPTPNTTTYNLSEVNGADDSIPAWIKAVLNKQKNM